MPADPQPAAEEHPAVLMLGKGWFPDEVGGLDRYFRDLLEHQPEARGVVIGPASKRPARVEAVSHRDEPLHRRLVAFAVAARRGARDAAVVDAHFALYALVPLLSRRFRAKPAVVHFQGPWAAENVAQGDESVLRGLLRRALERIVYRRASRVVVLSSAFRRLLVERYGVSPWRVRVEPPGVDLECFSPGDRERARAGLGLAAGSFLAVCVRRLVPRMGLDLLIDAWQHALADLPPHATLLIAGDGPQREALEARIAAAELRDSVRLLGHIDDEALVDLFRAADVNIVPTRSFEGFGLVVFEAAACGTPSIVTAVGGLPEAVAGLDASLAVAAQDVPALSARLVRAAGSAGLPSREATRAFAMRHSWQRVMERNRAVHREALAGDDGERRMRVVYLDHVAQLSGGEIALLRLVPHLADVEPHVILAEDGPFADALVHASISAEVLAMGEGARGLRKGSVAAGAVPIPAIVATARYILRLALRLHRLRPDVVHTNSLKSGVYGSIAARLVGVPVVWHVRDRISPDYLPGAAVRLVRAMTRRLTAGVIANSQTTMRTLVSDLPPPVTYSVVPEAIVGPTTAPPRTPGPFTVGMVGRLAPWKGQDLFLRAFAEAFPSGDERCVIVGSSLFGEDDYDRRIRRLAADLGLDRRVAFRGFCSDPWAEYARMDVLVHASLIPEPFGQVILEGMAARVPVVATAAGGPGELITHGIDGLLYPIGDQAALARAIRELAASPQQRARLVAGGSATVAAYHPAVVASRVQGIYRNILDDTPGRT